MKFLAIALIALVACGRPQQAVKQDSEKSYTMKGQLVSRNAAKNVVTIDNEDVPGVMSPMVMDYELRGAKIDSLPPDGSKITSTLHEQNGKYWVTDIKPLPPRS
jgi:hypothetical protein